MVFSGTAVLRDSNNLTGGRSGHHGDVPVMKPSIFYHRQTSSAGHSQLPSTTKDAESEKSYFTQKYANLVSAFPINAKRRVT